MQRMLALITNRTMPKPVAKMGTALVTTLQNRQCLKRGLHQALPNGNVTDSCKNFSNRDLALCQNAYYYGKDPLGNNPIQCTDRNSCYTLGRDAGYSSAMKEIIRYHLISVPPAF